MGIFPLGGHAAADMPFLFILFQHRFDLLIQAAVDLGQALGDILMYGGLTDMKFLGGLPHGGPGFDDVLGETDGPVLR